MIEDFGNADNLMIDGALAEQEHPIFRYEAPQTERFRALVGFEVCLKLAADTLLTVGHTPGMHA